MLTTVRVRDHSFKAKLKVPLTNIIDWFARIAASYFLKSFKGNDTADNIQYALKM